MEKTPITKVIILSMSIFITPIVIYNILSGINLVSSISITISIIFIIILISMIIDSIRNNKNNNLHNHPLEETSVKESTKTPKITIIPSVFGFKIGKLEKPPTILKSILLSSFIMLIIFAGIYVLFNKNLDNDSSIIIIFLLYIVASTILSLVFMKKKELKEINILPEKEKEVQLQKYNLNREENQKTLETIFSITLVLILIFLILFGVVKLIHWMWIV